MQHPVAERLDHAGALGHGDEVAGRHQAAVAVAPAHERLDADHAAVVEPHHRLVVQLELAALDPAPQPRRERQPLERVGRPVAVDVDAAAGRLGRVHRGVGVLAQLVRARGVEREQAEADARVHEQLGGAERERRLQGVGDPLADRVGVRAAVARNVAHEHEELVAALARYEIAGPDGGAQPLRDLAQQLVAGVVPERVVDPLELVQVGVRERDPGAVHPRVGDRGAQREVECGAVRQPGERVVVRGRGCGIGEPEHHLRASAGPGVP